MKHKVLTLIFLAQLVIIGYFQFGGVRALNSSSGISYQINNMHCFYNSLATMSNAIRLFEAVCKRRVKESEGLEVFTKVKINDCDDYNFNAPILFEEEIVSLRYLKGNKQDPAIVYKNGNRYFKYAGRDLVMGTRDDIFMPIRTIIKR